MKRKYLPEFYENGRNYDFNNPTKKIKIFYDVTDVYKNNRRIATPKWLSVDHKTTISQIYQQCKKLTELTGVKHQVDHIVPLKGKTVSGLHVPWNLQILTASDNSKKKNHY